ncbi:MAG: FkbM family methyltransferase [Chitinophagaceae bacterium]|nr:FkbM family methyltransferase [Chitinophagaceae bacterium]
MYYSQYQQDFFIDKIVLNKLRNGFFVEVGAFDGIHLSNTYFFEKYRVFNGICIEPVPYIFYKLKVNRNCVCLNFCIANQMGEVDFLVTKGTEVLSGIQNEFTQQHIQRLLCDKDKYGFEEEIIKIETIPFSQLMTPKIIDYCSIDTEGNELSVLKSIDYESQYIRCFSVENNYYDQNIEIFLKEKKYRKLIRLGDDEIFIHESEYNLKLKARFFIYLLFKYVNRLKGKLSLYEKKVKDIFH